MQYLAGEHNIILQSGDELPAAGLQAIVRIQISVSSSVIISGVWGIICKTGKLKTDNIVFTQFFFYFKKN